MSANVAIFGIRHHGPGSARSLAEALNGYQPDLLLIEGPPDAESALIYAHDPAFQPPVALLVYAPDHLQQAAYYPFAIFSPEWQALQYAAQHQRPARFFDLPQQHQLALRLQPPEAMLQELAHEQAVRAELHAGEEDQILRRDPLRWLAEVAGYQDGERWWDRMVEQRRDTTDLFPAILEAMTALRQAAEAERVQANLPAVPFGEALREAWMRQSIRQAQREGFQRIAVVCGAWHGPALVDMGGSSMAKADAALLKGLPKIKTEATWVPWTYGRLDLHSGYGAGITSPGWYDHLWQMAGQPAAQITLHWMSNVARFLRAHDLDASAAHTIEAVRLAESLAALRGYAVPGLNELNEAILAVFCFGNPIPLQLINQQLIVGERMGQIPDHVPSTPLQQDLLRQQRRLKLPGEANWRDYELDLRKPFDLERSHLLRQLRILGVTWAELLPSSGTGTFQERWRLAWQPEFTIALIEASVWGNTVQEAANQHAQHMARELSDLPVLVGLVNQVLLANLPDAVAALIGSLQQQSAQTSDIGQLMDALTQEDRITRTSFIQSLRYGTVRKTDSDTLAAVVHGMVLRIAIGLPGACGSLNDDAAMAMFKRIVAVDTAIRLLQNQDLIDAWYAALAKIADLPFVHGIVAGRCCRILLEQGIFPAEEGSRRINLALSLATTPEVAAAWVEGLLSGSGAILRHDDLLWGILDRWVTQLPDPAFIQILPLLRRTFATFEAAERRQLGERAKREGSPTQQPARSTHILDRERAYRALDRAARLLGLHLPSEGMLAAVDRAG
ncbi:MAG: DUF5682 family protein [Roseiflexaceae bacterium]